MFSITTNEICIVIVLLLIPESREFINDVGDEVFSFLGFILQIFSIPPCRNLPNFSCEKLLKGW